MPVRGLRFRGLLDRQCVVNSSVTAEACGRDQSCEFSPQAHRTSRPSVVFEHHNAQRQGGRPAPRLDPMAEVRDAGDAGRCSVSATWAPDLKVASVGRRSACGGWACVKFVITTSLPPTRCRRSARLRWWRIWSESASGRRSVGRCRTTRARGATGVDPVSRPAARAASLEKRRKTRKRASAWNSESVSVFAAASCGEAVSAVGI